MLCQTQMPFIWIIHSVVSCDKYFVAIQYFSSFLNVQVNKDFLNLKMNYDQYIEAIDCISAFHFFILSQSIQKLYDNCIFYWLTKNNKIPKGTNLHKHESKAPVLPIFLPNAFAFIIFCQLFLIRFRVSIVIQCVIEPDKMANNMEQFLIPFRTVYIRKVLAISQFASIIK